MSCVDSYACRLARSVERLNVSSVRRTGDTAAPGSGYDVGLAVNIERTCGFRFAQAASRRRSSASSCCSSDKRTHDHQAPCRGLQIVEHFVFLKADPRMKSTDPRSLILNFGTDLVGVAFFLPPHVVVLRA